MTTACTNPEPVCYITKDGSAIRELLNAAVSPGLGLSLAEAAVEPGGATEPHFHSAFDEIYYCLEGEGTLHVDGKTFPFVPGGFFLLPKEAVHHLRATTRLRLLCICCPGYDHEHTILTAP